MQKKIFTFLKSLFSYSFSDYSQKYSMYSQSGVDGSLSLPSKHHKDLNSQDSAAPPALAGAPVALRLGSSVHACMSVIVCFQPCIKARIVSEKQELV